MSCLFTYIIFTSLLLLSYHTMSSSCLISIALYLLVPACWCSRHGFPMHVYDLDLSTHLCLSMLATWLSHHHSPGSSDSSGFSCPDLRAWTVGDLPAEDQAYFCGADIPAVAPVLPCFPWLARGISSYPLSLHLYYSYLYHPCILAIAPYW